MTGSRWVAAGVAVLAAVGLTMAAAAPGASAAESRGDKIALLADANIGKHYCSKNSLGGKGFQTSCGGEYWCSDFAKWVWVHNGVSGTGVINDYAWSVYHYGELNHTLHSKPAVGDLAVYSVKKGDTSQDGDGINHTAVVTGWSDYGKKVHTISGDWENHPSGNGPGFWTKSTVVDNGEYNSSGYSSTMGYWIIGYVSPK